MQTHHGDGMGFIARVSGKVLILVFILSFLGFNIGCDSLNRKPGDLIIVYLVLHNGFPDNRPEFKKNPLFPFYSVRNIYYVGTEYEKGDYKLIPEKKMSVMSSNIKGLQEYSNICLRCDGGKLGYLYIPRKLFGNWDGVSGSAVVHLMENGEIVAQWE